MGLDPYFNCHPEIRKSQCTLDTCCLAQSSFLYRPSYSGNMFFTIIFAAFVLPQVALGIRYKTWGFMAGMIMGCILEAVGYCARVGLHVNPFSNNAFLMYLICLTIAPVFISAAIYLCLSRIIILYGEHLSFFKPRTLALVFMTSDFLSLVLQAMGGAKAETAIKHGDDATGGKNIMIAGLLLQVISLAFFLTIWILFLIRVKRGQPDQSAHKMFIRQRLLFHLFSGGLLLSTIVILIRSIYRVIELWGGFRGKLWNDETDFLWLDGAMVLLAVVLFTALHPGPAFAGQWNSVNWSLRGNKPKDLLAGNPEPQATSGGRVIELWPYDKIAK